MSKRIAKEFAELQKQPPEDMKVDLISETDLFKWVITITGPKDTPYAGGKFEVHATLPNQYPFKPPVINWKTKIYHPNVTNDGKGTMCLGFLRDGEWKPSSRMSTALEYVRQLMLDPVPEDAVEQAVANEYNNNKKQFIKTAKLWTKTYAGGPG